MTNNAGFLTLITSIALSNLPARASFSLSRLLLRPLVRSAAVAFRDAVRLYDDRLRPQPPLSLYLLL